MFMTKKHVQADGMRAVNAMLSPSTKLGLPRKFFPRDPFSWHTSLPFSSPVPPALVVVMTSGTGGVVL